MAYLWHILVMITLYVPLALSLNLVTGLTGLLSLCHAAFYGIGAYVCTLLVMKTGLPYYVALPCASIAAGMLSLMISIPALKLKGDFYVLATLGFQIIVFGILYNWDAVTNGAYGITGVPAPSFFGLPLDNEPLFLCLSAPVALAIAAIAAALGSSPFGRALRAIREDELPLVASGRDTARVKTVVFAISAALAAIPGGLFAGYIRFIDPTSFTIEESIFLLSIVIIGGAGSLWGPVIGAVLMLSVPEALRFLQMPDAIAAGARQIILGLLLILLLRFRPQGVAGEYRFE